MTTGWYAYYAKHPEKLALRGEVIKAYYEIHPEKLALKRARDKAVSRELYWQSVGRRPTLRTCPRCGIEFSGRLGKKYCSPRCVHNANEAKRRERMKARRNELALSNLLSHEAVFGAELKTLTA